MEYPELFNSVCQPLICTAENWSQTIIDGHPGREFNTILDIGCGPGRITVVFAEKFRPKNGIIAIDISGKAIEFAKENNGHPKIDYHVADVCGDLSHLRNSKFWLKDGVDMVISNFSLQSVTDEDQAARNMYNSVSAGGLTCNMISYYTHFIRRGEAIRDCPTWKEFLKFAPPAPIKYSSNEWESDEGQLAWCQKWTRRFERAGFVDVNTTMSYCCQTFDTRDHLYAFQRSISVYDKYIPDRLREKFHEDYCKLAFPESDFIQRNGVNDFEQLLGVLVGHRAMTAN